MGCVRLRHAIALMALMCGLAGLAGAEPAAIGGITISEAWARRRWGRPGPARST
jgi:hypothetical protein